MRLIDADDIIVQLEAKRNNWDNKKAIHRAMRGAYVDSILIVRDAPTVEVEPVRHGRWIKWDDYVVMCSECGKLEKRLPALSYPYCHCGAKMDGGKDNDNT